MTDNRQTTRTFQCREALWACFEQMARELECSVDYLLNDAMKQYARQRGYNSMGADSHSPSPASSSLPPSLRPSTPMMRAPLPPAPMGRGMPGGAAAARAAAGACSGAAVLRAAATARAAHRCRRRRSPPLAGSRRRRCLRRPPTRQMPAAKPRLLRAVVGAAAATAITSSSRSRMGAPMPAAGGARPTVNIYYMGERYPVTKDRFIIGRGRQSSDLTIKDPNVSRQHAMIEYLNGYYYIVDMGSTNGVEYAGQRIQRRVVGEGDTFRVCDHELRFSYH